MSVKGLLDAEKKTKKLSAVLRRSLNTQAKELKQELQKIEFLLADKDQVRLWRSSPAGAEKVNSIIAKLDEVEKLYTTAGNSQAGVIFKNRMKKQLTEKLTNLKANEIELKVRTELLRQQSQLDVLQALNNVHREGASRELYAQARQSGGFLSGVGRGYMKDLITLDTKSAGSKTLGKYMENLFNSYEEELRNVFIKGIVRGDSYKQMENNLMNATNITQRKANMLVRTEANAIFNQSVRNVIEDNPLVKGYRFRSVLDSRTSKICQSMDGKYIPKEEVKPGVNYPPLHPNCRSTVTTVLVGDKDKQDMVERYTKNGANQWVKVPPGMTYLEYKHKFGFANSKNPRTFNPRTRNIRDTSLARIERPIYRGYVKPSASASKRIDEMVKAYLENDTEKLVEIKSNTGFANSGKAILRQAQAESGFDGLPLTLDPAQFEKQVSSPGYVKLYRQVTSPEFAEQFKRGEQMYGYGRNNYGAGTYAFTEPPTEEKYGGTLIEMAVRYDESKVLDFTDFGFESQIPIGEANTPDMRINLLLSKADTPEKRKTILSALATQYGYDAIRVNNQTGKQFMILLNRTAVIVKE